MRRFCFFCAVSVFLLSACQPQSATRPVEPQGVSASSKPSVLPSSAPSANVVLPISESPTHSPIPILSPVPAVSPSGNALGWKYLSLEAGPAHQLQIQAGEKQYYVLKTEPGQRYTLKTLSHRFLQKLYLGSQAQIEISQNSPEEDLDLDFVAEYPAYYLVLTSYFAMDYQLIFQVYGSNPTPTPTPTFDCECDDPNTFLRGRVFDDAHSPLDGVTIRIRSLSSYVPFDRTTVTSGGSYTLNNAPSGIRLQISASRLGYTKRFQTVVLTSSYSGAPNRYDFGNDGRNTIYGKSYDALSDKPEVSSVLPWRNASGIDNRTSFKLSFSEPMDKATVENNFEIYAFNNRKLSVDTRVANSSVVGSGDINLLTGTRIWDKDAFNVSWNSDDTEVTFTFKDNLALPTDRDLAKTPDYQVGLNRLDGVIKDKSGISRGVSEKKFKLTDGDFERSYKFSIKVDEKKPMLTDISLLNPAAMTGLSLIYSEAMQIPTLGGIFAGGLGGTLAAAPAALPGFVTAAEAAGNYLLTLRRKGQTIYDKVSWASLGGEATLDPLNARRVLLNKAPLTFEAGDEIEMEAAETLMDPAGNTLDPNARVLKLTVGAM